MALPILPASQDMQGAYTIWPSVHSGHSVSHESPALVSAPLYMGFLVSHENGVAGANDNYALLL